MKRILLSLALVFTSNVCLAQFSGPSIWNTTPQSNMGTVTNGLTITDTPTGFFVSGQVLVNLTGPANGILAHWVVDRPVISGYSGTVFTTTVLDGFSLPPAGPAGNSTGVVETIFTDFLGTTTSLSSIPMNLVNGVDSPVWNNLSASSASVTYTAGPTVFLRQWFFLEGVWNGGAGTWTIDVPVESHVIPEPSTYAMLGTALVCLAGWRLKRRTLRK